MAINIEIEKEKGTGESSASMLRRFTKKVQGSGILPRVRSIRYASRNLSSYKVKMQRLASLKKKGVIEEQIKLGKMQERSSMPRSRR